MQRRNSLVTGSVLIGALLLVTTLAVQRWLASHRAVERPMSAQTAADFIRACEKGDLGDDPTCSRYLDARP